MAKSKTKPEKYGLSRYFLLTMLLSLLGWAFETAYMRVATGRWLDRGFMTLPFCPIYGCTLIFVYFLAGTPKDGRFLLSRVNNAVLRYALYFLIAFLVPSIMELLVGLLFDKTLHMRLWSYGDNALNIGGFVCLRNSLIWAVLIVLFMRFLFPLFKRLIGILPKFLARILAFALLIVLLADTSYNIATAVYR